MFKTTSWIGGAALLTALAWAQPAMATTALSVTGGSSDSHGNSGDLGGWVFTTADAINVTALGILNEGVTHPHFVGIYDNGGHLIVGESVGAGPGEGVGHQFTYDDLVGGPVLLGPGTYFIGELYGNSGDDPFLLGADTPTMAAGLTYDGFGLYVGVSNGNQDQGPNRLGPQNFSEGNAFFGPDFKFEPAGVPEPGSLALLGLGAAGFIARRRRK